MPHREQGSVPGYGAPHVEMIQPVAQIPQGAVIITPSEIFHEMRGIRDDVRDMKAEMRNRSNHESRIRSLEHRMWLATGIATVLGSSVTLFVVKLLGLS